MSHQYHFLKNAFWNKCSFIFIKPSTFVRLKKWNKLRITRKPIDESIRLAPNFEGSLGVLALGAKGVTIWRLQKKTALQENTTQNVKK